MPSFGSGCLGSGPVLIKQLTGLEVVKELFEKPLQGPAMAHHYVLCGQKLIWLEKILCSFSNIVRQMVDLMTQCHLLGWGKWPLSTRHV